MFPGGRHRIRAHQVGFVLRRAQPRHIVRHGREYILFLFFAIRGSRLTIRCSLVRLFVGSIVRSFSRST